MTARFALIALLAAASAPARGDPPVSPDWERFDSHNQLSRRSPPSPLYQALRPHLMRYGTLDDDDWENVDPTNEERYRYISIPVTVTIGGRPQQRNLWYYPGVPGDPAHPEVAVISLSGGTGGDDYAIVRRVGDQLVLFPSRGGEEHGGPPRPLTLADAPGTGGRASMTLGPPDPSLGRTVWHSAMSSEAFIEMLGRSARNPLISAGGAPSLNPVAPNRDSLGDASYYWDGNYIRNRNGIAVAHRYTNVQGQSVLLDYQTRRTYFYSNAGLGPALGPDAAPPSGGRPELVTGTGPNARFNAHLVGNFGDPETPFHWGRAGRTVRIGGRDHHAEWTIQDRDGMTVGYVGMVRGPRGGTQMRIFMLGTNQSFPYEGGMGLDDLPTRPVTMSSAPPAPPSPRAPGGPSSPTPSSPGPDAPGPAVPAGLAMHSGTGAPRRDAHRIHGAGSGAVLQVYNGTAWVPVPDSRVIASPSVSDGRLIAVGRRLYTQGGSLVFDADAAPASTFRWESGSTPPAAGSGRYYIAPGDNRLWYYPPDGGPRVRVGVARVLSGPGGSSPTTIVALGSPVDLPGGPAAGSHAYLPEGATGSARLIPGVRVTGWISPPHTYLAAANPANQYHLLRVQLSPERRRSIGLDGPLPPGRSLFLGPGGQVFIGDDDPRIVERQGPPLALLP